jgi:hypothetical protein
MTEEIRIDDLDIAEDEALDSTEARAVCMLFCMVCR